MRLKKLAVVSAFVCLAGLFGGGCADDRATIYIDHVAGFEPGGECIGQIATDSTVLFNSRGTYDPQTGVGYFAPLVIGNQLAPLGDNDTLKSETSRVQLEGAEVHFDPPELPAFTANFAATVQPDSSTNPGLAQVTVMLIPPNSGLPDGSYQVTIRAFGETLGGTKVETGDFVYPIDVVSGSHTTNCLTFEALEAAERDHPCGYYQDGYQFPCGSLSNSACPTCP